METGSVRSVDQAVAAVVQAAMVRCQVPGVAVGIVQGDQSEISGFGVNNVDHPLSVDADTLFQIGSITKTVVGTAAMRLVERGELALDVPIRQYLPELRLASEETAARVTLGHLFTHTGGWLGDYFADTGAGDDALARLVATMAELPQLTPLGQAYSYNNAGFFLAGRVIEVVTGHSLERALRTLVLDPLGMSSTFFRHFPLRFITRRIAAGHTARNGRPVVLVPWARPRSAAASGGLVTRVVDILRYARFHLGDGTTHTGARLLQPKTIAQMQTPSFPTDTLPSSHVGITWMLDSVGGERIVRHGGSTFGQRASLTLVPRHGFAVAVLTNGERGDEVCSEITRVVLRDYLGLADRQPEVENRSAEALAPYVGRYAAGPVEIELSAGEGILLLRELPRGEDATSEAEAELVRLGFVGPDRVVLLDSPFKASRAEFLRDAAGQIAWLRFGGRLHARRYPST
jgi:CubicO group peptidase (beta-lactamase class C family)